MIYLLLSYFFSKLEQLVSTSEAQGTQARHRQLSALFLGAALEVWEQCALYRGRGTLYFPPFLWRTVLFVQTKHCTL